MAPRNWRTSLLLALVLWDSLCQAQAPLFNDLPGLPSPVLQRFPPPETVSASLRFNRACHRFLVGQQVIRLHHREAYQRVLDCLDVSWIAWNALDDAQDVCSSCHDDALVTLRTALGDEAYYAGHMPPPVPYWLFEEVK